MSTHDSNNREYAQLSLLKPGSIVVPDGGFFCLKTGTPMTVFADENDDLIVYCEAGSHYLDNQLSGEDKDHIVGFYPFIPTEEKGE